MPPRAADAPCDPNAKFWKFLIRESVWRRCGRWGLGILAFVLFVLVQKATGWLVDEVIKSGIESLAGVVAAAALLLLGFFVSILSLDAGLRLLRRRGDTILKRSRQRPILFLRSFGDDAGFVDHGEWRQTLNFIFRRYESYERSLSQALKGVGPMIAVGRPRERLPPMGAARLYIADQWQEVVAELIVLCRFIVLRVGETPGFWWEFAHLTENEDPEKVLIYLPPKDRAGKYALLRSKVAELLGRTLPSDPGKAMFVAFRAGWEPILLGAGGPSRAARARRVFSGTNAPAVREALNDGLRTLGEAVRRLPLMAREWQRLLIVNPARVAILISCAIVFWPIWQRYQWENSFRFEPRVVVEVESTRMANQSQFEAAVAESERRLGGIPGVRHLEVRRFGPRHAGLALQLAAEKQRSAVELAVQDRLQEIEASAAATPVAASLRLMPDVDEAFYLLAVRIEKSLELQERFSESPELPVLPNRKRTEIVDHLRAIPGVQDVHDLGPFHPDLRIEIKLHELAHFELSLQQLLSSLDAAATATGRRFRDKAQLEKLPLATTQLGQSIELEDVAEIRVGNEPGTPPNADRLWSVLETHQRESSSQVLLLLLLVELKPGVGDLRAQWTLALNSLRQKLHANWMVETHRFHGRETALCVQFPADYRVEDINHLGHLVARVLFKNWRSMENVFQLRTPDGFICLFTYRALEDWTPGFTHEDWTPGFDEASDRVLNDLYDIPGVDFATRQVRALRRQWPGDGMQFALLLTGERAADIEQTAAECWARAWKLPGVTNVHVMPSARPEPEIQLEIDQEQCRFLRLDPAFTRLLEQYLAQGELPLELMYCGDHIVRCEIAGEPLGEYIRDLQSRGSTRRWPLAEFVRLGNAAEPEWNYRIDGHYGTVVGCNIQSGSEKSVRAELRRIAEELSNDRVRVHSD